MLACPTARKDESPKSLVNRYYCENYYTSLRSAFGYSDSDYVTSRLLFGDHRSIQNLCEEIHAQFKLNLTSSFYIQKEGFTHESPIIWDGCEIPFSFFEPKSTRVCPVCAQDHFIHKATDFSFINACPIHQLRLYDRCMNCDRRFSWNYGRITHCRFCSSAVSTYPQIHSAVASEQTLLTWIEQGRSDDVTKVLFILNALRRNFPREIFLNGKLLAMSINIARENVDDLLSELAYVFPAGDVPNRLLLSPIFTALEEHETFTNFLTPCLGGRTILGYDTQVKKQTLRLPEVEFALGLSANTISKMKSNGFLVGHITETGYEGVTVGSVYALIQSFEGCVVVNSGEQVGKWVSFDRDVIANLSLMRSGALQVHSIDWSVSMGSAKVRRVRDNSSMAPKDFVSIVEFAALAKTYPDAVRRLIKAGFITPDGTTKFIPGSSSQGLGHTPRGGGGAAFSRTAALQFCAQYCFLSEIAKRVGKGRTVLSAVLAAADIAPVSGPTVDGALIPLYRRSDVDNPNLNLSALIDEKKFQSKAGRKKEGEVLFDRKQWMPSKEISKLFGFCPVDLSLLVDQGLVESGVPPGRERDNARYYLRSSVEAFKELLANAVELSKACSDLDITAREFYKRFLDSGFCKTVTIAKKRYLVQADMQRVRENCERYVSLSTATRLLGAPGKHFYNLQKTNRIETVSPSETIAATHVHLIEREKAYLHGVMLPEKNIAAAIAQAKDQWATECST